MIEKTFVVKYSICPTNDPQTDLATRTDSLKTNEFVGTLKANLEQNIEASFVDKLLEHIQKKQLREPTVYKAAQIDRRLFSKIISDRTYKPAKDTCIALILALHLNHNDALDLLSRAGYTLSHSSKRDVIIEFFIHKQIYDLNYINEVVYRLGEKTFGR